MKRHPVLARLSRDHHKALLTAQLIKKDAPEYRGMPSTTAAKRSYTMEFFREHLKEHFLKEEKILFQKTRNKSPSIDALLEELTAEHRAIESFIQQLETDSNIEAILHSLGILLESHIRKEERVLFPQLEAKLSEAEFTEIDKLMNDRDEMQGN